MNTMLPEMTPAVARALAAAPRWASALGNPQVEPVHLVLGLLEEEDGRATRLFEQAALTRTAILHHLGRSLVPSTTAANVPLSPLAEKVLRDARIQAAQLDSDPTVTSEAFLLAAIEQDAALRKTLEALGLRLSDLVASIAALYGAPGASSTGLMQLDEPLQLSDPVEHMDAARILDAAANRASEALRVIEDHCRFSRNDAVLTEQLKQFRHELTRITIELLPAHQRLAARDTAADVGTAIGTASERTRHSLTGVVEANLKRLQESLRSLEEFAKLSSPALALQLEQLRYRSYTLEKSVLRESLRHKGIADARLYVLISGAGCCAALDWTIAEAAAGGAQVIQLREKGLDDRALLDRARRVRRWTTDVGACFIVNDRPDIARLAEADGVHLGQTDMSVSDARRILGPNAIIGVSTHDPEQLRQAVTETIDYVAVGPIFSSQTKSFDSLVGVDLVRQAATITDMPWFAIGGLNTANLPEVIDAGAKRIAVSHAICQANDPRQAARLLRERIDAAWQDV
jgi:thiamine-phosphate pyrophosphorylase